MATRKPSERADAKKGQKRFVDQPGQWRDATPSALKKKKAKGWAELEKMMKSDKKTTKKKK